MKQILRDFFMYTHMWQTWINHREDLITTLFGLIVILFVFFFGIIFFLDGLFMPLLPADVFIAIVLTCIGGMMIWYYIDMIRGKRYKKMMKDTRYSGRKARIIFLLILLSLFVFMNICIFCKVYVIDGKPINLTCAAILYTLTSI